MRYWWVNHKQTFRQEFSGNYIWCPKRKANGHLSHFYETVREVCPGDIVFSFAFGALQGFGFAQSFCYSCPRPNDFGKIGEAWDVKGWRVDIGFNRFEEPFRVADHAAQVAPLLPSSYSPIRANGHGNQGAYLAEISRDLAYRLATIVRPPVVDFLTRAHEGREQVLESKTTLLSEWEDRQEKLIEHQAGLSATQRRALILARCGQGLFRQRVATYESSCRVTRVDNPAHLIASHIKPWRESDDDERLEASNGLMLTPSIDHLFDRGFISFSDEGDILFAPIADRLSLKRMGLDPDVERRVGKFTSDQKHFLSYHRNEIFLKSAA